MDNHVDYSAEFNIIKLLVINKEIMQALELKAKLNNLTLVGYEDGDYQWVGTDEDWDNVASYLGEIGENGEHDCLVSRSESAGCIDDTGTCMTCGKTDLI